jgi:hypothetical protein
MAALVRYSLDGWTMNLALKEAAHYRFLKQFRPHLCAQQRRFLKSWTERHAPGALRPRG